jgi:P-type Cu2+ transporter
LRCGVLVKTPDGLERISQCDYVVFDKTGTLTLGEPRLLNPENLDHRQREIAVGLARNSRHPLSRAVVRAFDGSPSGTVEDVEEIPGRGIVGQTCGQAVYLGNRAHCCVDESLPEQSIEEQSVSDDDAVLELWFNADGETPVRLKFSDSLRPDGETMINAMRSLGLGVEILSGDREIAVAETARALKVKKWSSQCLPGDKVKRLEELKTAGFRVLMVGDGLNDAPALAGGFASISPSSAPDISQTAADLVFRGDSLSPVVHAVRIARFADRLVKQNFALAIGYNMVAVPLAIAGFATPLVAAIAMSSSSILVTLNALRLRLIGRT